MVNNRSRLFTDLVSSADKRAKTAVPLRACIHLPIHNLRALHGNELPVVSRLSPRRIEHVPTIAPSFACFRSNHPLVNSNCFATASRNTSVQRACYIKLNLKSRWNQVAPSRKGKSEKKFSLDNFPAGAIYDHEDGGNRDEGGGGSRNDLATPLHNHRGCDYFPRAWTPVGKEEAGAINNKAEI